MIAQFERFNLRLTKAQAASASHQGKCDEDVRALAEVPAIRAQLRSLDPAMLRAELAEYGTWDAEELANHEQNLQRILWLAAGNILEEGRK